MKNFIIGLLAQGQKKMVFHQGGNKCVKIEMENLNLFCSSWRWSRLTSYM